MSQIIYFLPIPSLPEAMAKEQLSGEPDRGWNRDPVLLSAYSMTQCVLNQLTAMWPPCMSVSAEAVDSMHLAERTFLLIVNHTQPHTKAGLTDKP